MNVKLLSSAGMCTSQKLGQLGALNWHRILPSVKNPVLIIIAFRFLVSI